MKTKKLLSAMFVGACLVALQGCRNGDESVTLKSNVARLAEAKAAVAIAEASLEEATSEARGAANKDSLTQQLAKRRIDACVTVRDAAAENLKALSSTIKK